MCGGTWPPGRCEPATRSDEQFSLDGADGLIDALLARVGFIVTNLEADSRAVVRFYNKRGTAEQWIKEGKQAVKMTRLSCHRFRSNEVRLWLSVIAYNLGNLWRLALPKRVDHWSLTSLQQRLVKTGGRLVKHARYYWLLLAEGHLSRRLFGSMLRMSAAHVATLLFDLFHSAQLSQGCVTRFLRGHPFSDLLLHQFFQVEAEFVGQLLLDAAPTEQRPKPKRQLVEPSHRDLPDSFLGWRSLLVSQGHHGIDRRCPARGLVAGQPRDY
jgi:hypothetical protein